MADSLFLSLFEFAGFIKLINMLILVLIVFYTIFAFLVIRQVSLLNSSFKTDSSFLFTVLALGHLAASIFILIVSITLL